ncbi:hypothetical protein DFH07DRAFT_973014 [Mycena maculata]|uniref:Uncharacterized protein n=1 Tax=Mycena maculata TaxID=230809 RepID=A0AAD7MIN2_9AGAR|nr:hypothetical protein DFH07DRAFT_973014 [Mycena maculata]
MPRTSSPQSTTTNLSGELEWWLIAVENGPLVDRPEDEHVKQEPKVSPPSALSHICATGHFVAYKMASVRNTPLPYIAPPCDSDPGVPKRPAQHIPAVGPLAVSDSGDTERPAAGPPDASDPGDVQFTRSGVEFSPFLFENATPYKIDNISLRELLVRRADLPDSDTESLEGSDDEGDDDEGPKPPGTIFTASMMRASCKAATFIRWVTPPAPYLEKVIHVARPGVPSDPRPTTFTRWVTPPAPPAPTPYLERVICVPRPGAPPAPPNLAPDAVPFIHANQPATPNASHRSHKRTRAEVVEARWLKKRGRDREVQCEHREDRRVRTGTRLKGITLRRINKTKPVQLELDFANYPLPVAKSGWMGARQLEPDARAYDLDELLLRHPDMKVYDWQGTPTLVLDRDDQVILLLGGFPPNANWQEEVAGPVASAMETALIN